MLCFEACTHEEEERMETTGWLITHKNCLDGAAAAVVGQKCGLTPVFVEPDQVASAFALITDDKPLYLADVSLKPEQYEVLGARIHWLLDHHQTALPLKTWPGVTIDLSKSGSHLLYDYMVGHGMLAPSPQWSRLIRAVERYDLWQPCHGAGQNLNRLFHDGGYAWFYEHFHDGWTPYNRADQDRLAELIAQETTFIHAQLQRAVRTNTPLPMVAIPLSDEGPVNEIAHRLLESGAALVVFIKADGRLSARSDPRVDVAALMEDRFHGGGHARAAGGRLEKPGPYTPADARAVLEQIGDYVLSH